MNTWTLIGLIRCEGGDPTQKATCTAMFEDILSRQLPADVSIVVWLNMAAAWIPALDSGYVPPTASKDLNVTRFYAVENLPAPVGGRKSRLVHLDIKIALPDIRNPVHVQQFFAYIVNSSYAGKQNLLVSWGHGTSYGIFWDSHKPKPGRRYNMLDAEGLQKAIQGAFKNPAVQKLNVMIEVNCFTNFFDTCYALSDAGVEYLVAAPDGNMFAGYNYSMILSELYANTGMSPRALALLAVGSIDQDGSDLQTRLDQLKDTAIYADDLSYCDQMASLLNELGAALLQEIPQNVTKVDAALGGVPPYNPSYFDVDLLRLLKALQQAFGADWHSDLIAKIAQLGGSMLIDHYTGSNLKNSPAAPLGFTVCMPPSGTPASALNYYNTYFRPGSPFPSSFAKGSWAQFVDKFV